MQPSRVPFAIHHPTWSPDTDPADLLLVEGVRITASEFEKSMDGKIFCPVCRTILTRTPKDKLLFSNGRKACFAHLPRFADIECELRSPKSEGLKFESEVEARRSVEAKHLIVVHEFVSSRPEVDSSQNRAGHRRWTEGLPGPLASFPISRHRGDLIELPTELHTVRGICRAFDRNLGRYFLLPSASCG